MNTTTDNNNIMNTTTDFTTSSFMITTHEHGGMNQSEREILMMLNEEKARDLLPAMVLFGFFMVFGIVGNLLVCFVFYYRLQHSTQTYFFIWLAVLDLASCCVSMPIEIMDMRNYYTFDNAVACKVLRFFVSFPSMGSNVILLVIAVDRYRKVCRPLSPQMGKSIAKGCVVLAVMSGVVFSIPLLFIYGRRTTRTRIPDIYGSDCSVSDSVRDRLFPLVYELLLVVAFLAFTVALTVIYFMIWKTIQQHHKYMDTHTTFALKLLPKHSQNGNTTSQANQRRLSTESVDRPGVETETVEAGRTETAEAVRTESAGKTGTKTTVVAFLVTLVFVLSYVPHLSLIILRTVKKGFDLKLEGSGLCVYNIFLRSYFVNSVSNPVIYGFLNPEFRNQCEQLLIKPCVCATKK